MEAFFLIVLVMFYLLLDAPSAVRAFDSRIRQLPIKRGPRRLIMIYVFARWLPSETIRLDLPEIYYIPCESRETAEKLGGTLPRFGTDKASVIELPNIQELQKYVSNYYQLSDFELFPFPISTNKLLEGMG